MKILIPLLFASNLLYADLGLQSNGKLDMPAVQSLYRDGELEKVKIILETYMKESTKGDSLSRGEQIFTYKYLGVIYASNPDERIRAESFFNQLLPLAPNIELNDMFASKAIQKIFVETQKDYLRAQEYNSKYDAFGNPLPGVKGGTETGSKSHAWIWWTAGLTAVAAGSGTAYFMMQDEPTPRLSTHFSGGF